MGRNVTLSLRWPAWLNAVLLLIASFIGIVRFRFKPAQALKSWRSHFPFGGILSRPFRPLLQPMPPLSA